MSDNDNWFDVDNTSDDGFQEPFVDEPVASKKVRLRPNWKKLQQVLGTALKRANSPKRAPSPTGLLDLNGMSLDFEGPVAVPKKKVRATGWAEWLGTAILLGVVLKYGYTTMAIVGLLTAIVVMAVGSARSRTTFVQKIQNNNWVFWAMFWLMITSLLFWIFSLPSGPVTEFNPVKWAAEKVKDTVVPPSHDPYANGGV